MPLSLRLITLALLVMSTSSIASNHRITDPIILESGKLLYQSNCAVCHGAQAQSSVEDWHKADANGKLPPPPLNGTAHTWHHPIGALLHTIKKGTLSIGGSMPGWEQSLSDEEIFSIIVWFSSLWPDDIYNAWMQRNKS